MMRRFVLRFVLVAAVLWVRSAFYAVDVTEFAYVTRFGDPVATLDGGTDAGLHVKAPWPIDSVRRIDRRVQAFDLPTVEALTRDAAANTIDKTLAVDAFVTWRVPDAQAADRFVRTVGSVDQAKRLLAPQVNGRLAAAVSTLPLDGLIAVASPADVDKRSDSLRGQLIGTGPEALSVRLLADYGIELVDLRVRRVGYPEAVRQSIAERIRSERARKVAEYESDGRRRAADIASAADKEARTVEAEARAKKQLAEGLADVEADRIRNQAHAADPAFYAFLQKLKAYQAMLADARDVLLISTKHPLFDLLLSPPAGEKK